MILLIHFVVNIWSRDKGLAQSSGYFSLHAIIIFLATFRNFREDTNVYVLINKWKFEITVLKILAVFEIQNRLMSFPNSIILNEKVFIIRKVKELRTSTLLLISY